jgi:hypothetical protein
MLIVKVLLSDDGVVAVPVAVSHMKFDGWSKFNNGNKVGLIISVSSFHEKNTVGGYEVSVSWFGIAKAPVT